MTWSVLKTIKLITCASDTCTLSREERKKIINIQKIDGHHACNSFICPVYHLRSEIEVIFSKEGGVKESPTPTRRKESR